MYGGIKNINVRNVKLLPRKYKHTLTMYEVKNRGFWSYEKFGTPTMGFLFESFVPNVNHAIKRGYMLPVPS